MFLILRLLSVLIPETLIPAQLLDMPSCVLIMGAPRLVQARLITRAARLSKKFVGVRALIILQCVALDFSGRPLVCVLLALLAAMAVMALLLSVVTSLLGCMTLFEVWTLKMVFVRSSLLTVLAPMTSTPLAVVRLQHEVTVMGARPTLVGTPILTLLLIRQGLPVEALCIQQAFGTSDLGSAMALAVLAAKALTMPRVGH